MDHGSIARRAIITGFSRKGYILKEPLREKQWADIVLSNTGPGNCPGNKITGRRFDQTLLH